MEARGSRPLIARLFTEGKRICETAKLLNMDPSNVRTVKRFRETDCCGDKPRNGRTRTARTAKNRSRIRKRLSGKKRWSTRKPAAVTGISPRSTARIVKEDAHMRYWEIRQAHLLTEDMKEVRLRRSRNLLRRFAAGGHRSIVFSDEKILTTEQAFNSHNDGVWAAKSPGNSRLVEGSLG